MSATPTHWPEIAVDAIDMARAADQLIDHLGWDRSVDLYIALTKRGINQHADDAMVDTTDMKLAARQLAKAIHYVDLKELILTLAAYVPKIPTRASDQDKRG